METFRAQGILKRWKQYKSNDTDNSKTIPLMDFIQYQYNRYLTLCDRCNEVPVSLGPWLRQKITTAN